MSPYNSKGGRPVPGSGFRSPFEPEKPTVVGPVEEYLEPGIQRMSEHGAPGDAPTYTAPLGEAECDHCGVKYPLDYFHGPTCRYCFMMGH